MSRIYITGGTGGNFTTNDAVDGWGSPSQSEDSFENISKDLGMAGSVKFNRSEISVPSPWAAVITFDTLLMSNDKSFKNLSVEAKNEWRALMYLVAWKLIDENLFELKLVSLNTDKESMTYQEQFAVDFFQTLRGLRPESYLFDKEQAWNKLAFLRMNNCNIGILSDSYLVCPCYDYSAPVFAEAAKTLRKLRIMDNDNKFIDPTELISRDISLSVYMILYLKFIKDKLSVQKGNCVNDVSKLIDEYIEDIKGKSAHRGMVETLTAAPYQLMYFKAKKDTYDSTEDLLKNIELDRMEFQQESRIFEYLKVKDKPTYVADGLGSRFDNILSAYRHKEIVGLDLNNTDLLSESEIFLDKITLFECGKGRDDELVFHENDDLKLKCTYVDPKTENEQICQVILPFRSRIFDLISVDYIRKYKEIQATKNSITIGIRFVLDNGENVNIRRTYSLNNDKEVNILKKMTINTAIFPYCEITDKADNDKKNLCREYYVYRIADADNAYDAVMRHKNFKNSNEVRKWNIKEKGWTVDVQKYDSLPEYLLFTQKGGEGADEYGVYLPPAPKKIEIATNIECIVGFDLGTTSTTFFAKDVSKESDSQFIRFGDMGKKRGLSNDECIYGAKSYMHIMCNTLNNNSFIKSLCMPESYVPRKAYPSVIRSNTVGSDSAVFGWDEPFAYGNIIYNQIDKDEFTLGKIYSNFKWGEDDQDGRALRAYLGQMTYIIALILADNGVGSIKWRFSYPTSLSNNVQSAYKRSTQNAVDKIKDNMGIESNIDKDYCYYPESVVSAKFFETAQSYVCVDIGGGSTDISMWKPLFKNTTLPENIMQCSVGVASRKIFMEAFMNMVLSKDIAGESHNADELNPIRKSIENAIIKSDTVGISVKEGSYQRLEKIDNIKTRRREFIREFEPVLQMIGDRLCNDLYLDANNNPLLKKFKRFIAVGLYGIMFYIILSFEGRNKELAKYFEDNETLWIYLAGNGSRMFLWIEDEFKESIIKAFTENLKRIFNKNIRVQIDIQREGLKTEAAKGLIMMNTSVKDFENNSFLINGDKLTVKFKDAQNRKEEIPKEADINTDPIISEWVSNNNSSQIDTILPDYTGDKEDSIIRMLEDINKYIFNNKNNYLTRPIKCEEINAADMKSFIGEVCRENADNRQRVPAYIMKLEALLRELPKII